MKKREKGITLIALSVTITVLLIVSGITLTAFMNKDGILNQASEATTRCTKREYITKNRG